MKNPLFRCALAFIVFVTLLLSSSIPLEATFYGEDLGSGTHKFKFKKGEYIIYLPVDYDSEERYGLIIITTLVGGRQAVDPYQIMQSWMREADMRGYIIVMPIAGGMFGKVEDWYLALIKRLERTFPIDRKRILLIGFGESAHYAIFLGTRFPKEFTAVSPIAGTLDGFYSSFMRFDGSRDIPFYFICGSDDAYVGADKVRYSATRMEKKGYPVKFEEVPGIGHHYSDEITMKVADWFDDLTERK